MSEYFKIRRLKETINNRIESPKRKRFDSYKYYESEKTDKSIKNISYIIREHSEYLNELKRLNEKSLFSELMDKYIKNPSDEILHETGVKRQDYLQVQREEVKKLLNILQALKQRLGTKPERESSNQKLDERLRQLASFGLTKDPHTREIDVQIEAALKCQADLSSDIENSPTLKTDKEKIKSQRASLLS